MLQPLTPRAEPHPPQPEDQISELGPLAGRTPEPRVADETIEELQELMRRHAAAAASRQTARAPAKADHRPARPESRRNGVPWSAAAIRRIRTGWPLIALIVASAAILAGLLVITLGPSLQLFTGPDKQADTPPAPSSAVALPDPAAKFSEAAPVGIGGSDRASIEKAMTDCDAEAASHSDALYFLIVPLVAPSADSAFWTPLTVGDIGTSVSLLRSKDALDGLSSGRLAVSSKPYRFSIFDANTGVASRWPQTAGVARFIKPNSTAVGFQVSFGFPGLGDDAVSSFQFPRNKGECYWVSALRRN